VKIALVEPFGGASGDMFLAALVDAGAPQDALRVALSALGLSGWRLETSRAARGVISAACVQVHVEEEQPRRRLEDVLAIIAASGLSSRVKAQATAIFESLARAEAEVHGTQPEEVHFHEVGAVDSIVDIAGTCVAAELLGIERFYCREVPLGGGEIACAHGNLPCPAPATLKLLAGLPVRFTPERSELVTPTGAALLAALCEFTQEVPAFTLGATGCGAGQRDDPKRPNILRVTLGQTSDRTPAVWVVEANIDDMNPELYSRAGEALFAAGALDVYATPVQMKKSRPGVVLTALCPGRALLAVERAFFAHTTTFGVRRYRVERSELERHTETVRTEYGPVQVKLGLLNGEVVTASPEYESCVKASEASGVPVKSVYAAALASWQWQNKC
jgi:uncharacterized protein (TIGR00299 family) protein